MKKNSIALLLSFTLLTAALIGCGAKEDKAQAKSQDNITQESISREQNAKEQDAKEQDAPKEAKEQDSSSRIVFEAQDMDGNAVSSDIFANARLTMVNVWATYCNPCLSEMPGLGELAGKYDPEDFQLIGIISDVMEGGEEEQMAYAASLIGQTGADYTHLLLNRSLYNGLLTGVSAVPTTFFIDKEGNVLDTVIGAMDKAAWEEKINGFLEE